MMARKGAKDARKIGRRALLSLLAGMPFRPSIAHSQTGISLPYHRCLRAAASITRTATTVV